MNEVVLRLLRFVFKVPPLLCSIFFMLPLSLSASPPDLDSLDFTAECRNAQQICTALSGYSCKKDYVVDDQPLCKKKKASCSALKDTCEQLVSEPSSLDDRPYFSATLNFGYVYDQFDGGQLLSRQQSQGDVKEKDESWMLALDAQMRVAGTKTSSNQWWWYLKSLRTVRVAEGREVPERDSEAVRTVLEEANTLEYSSGLRYEFGRLGGGETWAAPYASAQLGFATQNSANNDFAQKHKFSVGAYILTGKHIGSFFDVGYGKNELFAEPDDRFIVTARLNFKGVNILGLARLASGTQFFIETEFDTDFGSDSDSSQTRIGWNMNLFE